MALLPRVPEWVTPIPDEPTHLQFVNEKGEPVDIKVYYITVVFSSKETAYIGKQTLDQITEVRGLIEERIDRDTFFDLDDTGKLNKNGFKRYKIVAFEGYDPRAKKSGAVETPPASQAAGPPSNSVSPPDSNVEVLAAESRSSAAPVRDTAANRTGTSTTSSDGVGDGEAPAPSGPYSSKPAPPDWGVS